MSGFYTPNGSAKVANTVRTAGFTIIEIVVSLVVLGILMGAMAGMLNSFRATSYQTAANNIALSMQQAVNMKFASVFQALSAQPSASCIKADTMCIEAYVGAVVLLTLPDGVEICGVNFAGSTPPFARGVEVGGGWVISGDKEPFMGAPLHLTGPDGRQYTSEIPLLEGEAFCQ